MRNKSWRRRNKLFYHFFKFKHWSFKFFFFEGTLALTLFLIFCIHNHLIDRFFDSCSKNDLKMKLMKIHLQNVCDYDVQNFFIFIEFEVSLVQFVVFHLLFKCFSNDNSFTINQKIFLLKLFLDVFEISWFFRHIKEVNRRFDHIENYIDKNSLNDVHEYVCIKKVEINEVKLRWNSKVNFSSLNRVVWNTTRLLCIKCSRFIVIIAYHNYQWFHSFI